MDDLFNQVSYRYTSHQQQVAKQTFEALGGETLEGSGFEEEIPETGFEEVKP